MLNVGKKKKLIVLIFYFLYRSNIHVIVYSSLPKLYYSHSQGLSDMWKCPVKGYSLLDQMTSRNLSTSSGVCECPVNLMLGPVIHTPLLNQMSIQLQYTLGTTGIMSIDIAKYLIV